MKQVKIAYGECKAKLPNRPPDEIDFGLGFRAALRWMKEKLNCEVQPGDIEYFIDEELQ